MRGHMGQAVSSLGLAGGVASAATFHVGFTRNSYICTKPARRSRRYVIIKMGGDLLRNALQMRSYTHTFIQPAWAIIPLLYT